MKAIFIGTLADGFALSEIIADDEKAEEIVIASLANGKLAEAIDVKSPSSLDKRASKNINGETFVVYSKGLGSGFNVYGPFANEDVAEEFGENNRADGDEWELFETLSHPSQSVFPT